jgi:hypothetical protein
MREGHPVLWTIDHERDDDLVVIRFPYFETSEPIMLDEGPQTYTDGDTSVMTNTTTAEWNHGLGEVVQAVLDAGLVLTGLVEERECAWSAVDRLMEGDHERWFRMREGGERLPLMYTLDARKP